VFTFTLCVLEPLTADKKRDANNLDTRDRQIGSYFERFACVVPLWRHGGTCVSNGQAPLYLSNSLIGSFAQRLARTSALHWSSNGKISVQFRLIKEFFTLRVVINLPYRAHFFEANGSGPSHNLIWPYLRGI